MMEVAYVALYSSTGPLNPLVADDDKGPSLGLGLQLADGASDGNQWMLDL